MSGSGLLLGDYGMGLIEGSRIEEVVSHLTGREVKRIEGNLTQDPLYVETMKYLAEDLCNRSSSFEKQVLEFDNLNMSYFNITKNLTLRGEKFYSEGRYYSSASSCFGAGVKFHHLIFRHRNSSRDEINRMDVLTRKAINDANEKLDEIGYETITGLEAYMVVRQRLIEAVDFLDASREFLEANETDDAYYNLAYSIERLYSANAWSVFLQNPSEKVELDREAVKAMRGKAVYFSAVGGAGSLYASKIVKVKNVFKKEFGMAEAIYELEVKDFPLLVTADTKGGNLYRRIEKRSYS